MSKNLKYFPPPFWPVIRSLENARRNLEKAVLQGEMIDPDSAWLGEIKKEYAYVRRLLNGMISAAIITNRDHEITSRTPTLSSPEPPDPPAPRKPVAGDQPGHE